MCRHLAEHIDWLDDNDHKHLFPGQRGPWSRRGFQQAWLRATELAGIEGKKGRWLSIHGARHTMATHLYRQTKDIVMTQEQLGHTNVNTTAKMYAGVSHEDKVQAMEDLYG
jgi:integrase